MSMRGAIGDWDVVFHPLAIVRGFGLHAFLRCTWAIVSREQCTFLDLALSGHREPCSIPSVSRGPPYTASGEDMAGKDGDIDLVRALRKNIAFHAPNSAAAKEYWVQHAEVTPGSSTTPGRS